MKGLLSFIYFNMLLIHINCNKSISDADIINQKMEILQKEDVLNFPFPTHKLINLYSEFRFKIFNNSLTYILVIPDNFNNNLIHTDSLKNTGQEDLFPPSSFNSSIKRISLIGDRDSYIKAHMFDCERVISDLCQLILDSSPNYMVNREIYCRLLFSTGILKTQNKYINSHILEDTMNCSLKYRFTSVNLSNNMKINIDIGSKHSLDLNEIKLHYYYFQNLFLKHLAEN